MSKDPTERKKYSRYLKSAEDNLKKAVLLDDYSNRNFTIITKISKSAKYRSRNPIRIIKGALIHQLEMLEIQEEIYDDENDNEEERDEDVQIIEEEEDIPPPNAPQETQKKKKIQSQITSFFARQK